MNEGDGVDRMMASANPTYLNKPNPTPLVLDPKTPVHFIGVGGIGMSGLAKVLLSQGFAVSGSDAQEGYMLTSLRELGATIYVGHKASQVPEGSVVVASSAITTENPEAAQAAQWQLPIYHRSDLLRELIQRYEVPIGITGTHGKTTITGMTGMVLEHGELDPAIIAGGKIPELQTNAKVSQTNRYVVAELDESDGTIVQYQPCISLISNLEVDHTDFYQHGEESLLQTFRTYLEGLSSEHTVFFNVDCPLTKELYQAYRHRVKAIAVYCESQPEGAEEPAYFMHNVVMNLEGGYQADVYYGADCIGGLWLQAPGKHNLWDGFFASVIGHHVGVPFKSIRRTLENFTGMGRRFEKLGMLQGAELVDDYAHHPTEVKAVLKAARDYNKDRGRVIAMFQPHRYERLRALWDDFLTVFEDADELIVVDVYSAGDEPMPGITGEAFCQALDHPGAEYWPSANWELVRARLGTVLTEGDLFITLGAGDVTHVGRDLLAAQEVQA